MAILNGLKLKGIFFKQIRFSKKSSFSSGYRVWYSKKSSISGLGWVSSSILDTHSKTWKKSGSYVCIRHANVEGFEWVSSMELDTQPKLEILEFFEYHTRYALEILDFFEYHTRYALEKLDFFEYLFC